MDLLDSILGSMDKPPSLSEQERKKARGKFWEVIPVRTTSMVLAFQSTIPR